MSFLIKKKFKILAVAVVLVAATVLILATACTGGANASVNFSGGTSFSGEAPNGETVREGQTIELPQCGMTRDGYVFHAWSDGKKEYQPGDKYVVGAGGVNFTAVWKKSKLKATFYEADGVTLLWETEVAYGKGLPFGYLGNDPTPPASEIAGQANVWDPLDGWDPAVPKSFTDDTVFKAKFESEAEIYRAVFLNEDGSNYGSSSGKYGDAIAAPSRNPEKVVSPSELHVERYDFIGWESATGADAVLPDPYGNVGEFAGNVTFYARFSTVMKQYTLSVEEEPEGAKVAVSGSAVAGGMFEVTVTLDRAYDLSNPVVTANFSGVFKNVSMQELSDGVWKGVIDKIEGSGTVAVSRVALNRYSVESVASNLTIEGLEALYTHGATVNFSVKPDAYYTQSTPVVTVNGIEVAGNKEVIDGAPVYRYQTTAETNMTIAAKSETKNRYNVTFVYGDGTEETTSVAAGNSIMMYRDKGKAPTAEFEYSFLYWTDPTAVPAGEFAVGDAVKIEGDRTFEAQYRATRRSYRLTFVTRDGEKSAVAEYGTAIGEIAAQFEGTVKETAETFTFLNWTTGGAAVAADATVEGDKIYQAVYRADPTLYRFEFNYSKDGVETATAIEIPYGTAFGAIAKPDADDKTAEGKYLVWIIDGKDASDGMLIKSDASAKAEYRIFRYEVQFADGTGTVVREWTVTVDWGEAAKEPPVAQSYRDERFEYTFTGWSRDFSSVKEDMTVRAQYASVKRVYAVDYRNTTDAEFVETTGDHTFESEATFRVKLADRIDPEAVTVFANGVPVAADGAGVYAFVVREDTEVYLTGAGLKIYRAELPTSETFSVEAIGSTVVEEGGSFRFRIVNGAAYSEAVPEVRVAGVLLTASDDGIYTVADVRENFTVEIADLVKNVYQVNAVAGEGIESVAWDPLAVEHGAAVTFTVTLKAEYAAKGLFWRNTTMTDLSVGSSGVVYTVVAPSVTERAEIEFYAILNEYLVEIEGLHFTADTLRAEVAHGAPFVATVGCEQFYDRAAPEVSYDGAKIERVAEGRYKITVLSVTENVKITVTPKLNVYTVTPEAGTGVAYDGGTIEAKHGSYAEFTVRKVFGYTDKAPVLTVSENAVAKVEERDGNWVVSIASVEGDLTVGMAGTANLYKMTLPTDAEAEAGGFASDGVPSAAFGNDYVFTVTLDASRNMTAPVVTMDGAGVIASVKKEGDVYTYRIEAVESAHYFTVETKINVYTVTFEYPDETVTREVEHAAAIAVPANLREHYAENPDAGTAQYLTGWTRDGKPVKDDFAGETATANATYTATATTRYLTAKIGEAYYLYVETALEAAEAGQTIDLLKPGTDASAELGGQKQVTLDRPGDKKDYELPTGVTLRLPYLDNAYSNFADGDKTRYNTAVSAPGFADSNPNLLNYALLLPEGYALNAYGTIEIGGIVSQPSIGRQGHTSGSYAELTVNGRLTLYGTLKTFGYVKGSGAFDAMSGATVYEPFVIDDYRGGTNTVTVAYHNNQKYLICPFNVYYFPNVQTALYTVNHGATEKGYASLYASSSHNATSANIIAPDESSEKSIIRLTEGAKVEKRPDPATLIHHLSFYGNVKDGELYLSISMGSASSNNFKLPVSYRYDLTLKAGAVATLSKKYKLLTGAKLTVEAGASLNLIAGAELIGYQEYVVQTRPVNYGAFEGTEYSKLYTANVPAQIKIDGVMNIDGAFGGILTGTGTVCFADTAILSLESKEGNSGNGGSLGAVVGNNTFYTVFETTQTARGIVGGVETAFVQGNTYTLS